MIEIGTKVRVKKSAKRINTTVREDQVGINPGWLVEMDDLIGKTGVIVAVDINSDDIRYQVRFERIGKSFWFWPEAFTIMNANQVMIDDLNKTILTQQDEIAALKAQIETMKNESIAHLVKPGSIFLGCDGKRILILQRGQDEYFLSGRDGDLARMYGDHPYTHEGLVKHLQRLNLKHIGNMQFNKESA